MHHLSQSSCAIGRHRDRSAVFTRVLVAGFVLLCLVGSTGVLGSEAARPNVVVLIADDIGYGELGMQGNDQIPTPHIDSIAENGVRFTAGYVTASFCSPSRAALMTGRYQRRFGREGNPVGAQNEKSGVGMPASEDTIAEVLQDAGYATSLIGKWHLGGTAPYHPLRHGFDYFYGFEHEGHYYVPYPYDDVVTWLRRSKLPDGSEHGRWRDGNLILSAHLPYNEPDYDANNPLFRNGQPVAEEAYLTDAFTREAVRFIERNQRRPFFLSVAYNAVHSPMQAPLTSMERFSEIDDIHRRIFAGMLARLDAGVGRILERLRALEMEEETMIVFISDNGGPTKELTSSNSPLRGGKGDLYEGGIRIPFAVQWKGKLPTGKVYRKPVSSMDILPTAAEAAGVPDGSTAKPDGVDLLPYLTGKRSEAPHKTLFWRMGHRKALRQGQWKIVTHRRNSNEWELYDLEADLGEQTNLAEKYPERLEALKQEWNRQNRRLKGKSNK